VIRFRDVTGAPDPDPLQDPGDEQITAHSGVSSSRAGEAARYASGHGDVSPLDPSGAPGNGPRTRDFAKLGDPRRHSARSTRTLEPAAIIELVVWLSVLQHRLGAYYQA
jgi:hypothetical protein